MSKYTSGKWKVIKMEGTEDLYVVSYGKKGWNCFPIVQLIPYGNAGKEEQEANACLIASAPELLTVCKWAEKALDWNQYEKGTIGYDIHQDMLKAIAKAERE